MNPFVLGGSIVAILLLAGTVWAFRLGGLMGLDEASARHEAEAAIAGFEGVSAAVSKAGDAALVEGRIGFALVRAHGAHHVVRPLLAGQIHVEGDSLIADSGEAIFGRTTLELGEADAKTWATKLDDLRSS